MKKKLIAAILTGAMLAAGLTTSVWADGEKTFVYGTDTVKKWVMRD